MFKEMQIRENTKEDNQALAGVIRKVFEEHQAPKEGTVYSDPTTDDLFHLFQRSDSALFVAEYHSKVVGCCGIYPTEGLDKNCAELVKFYLAEEARGKGIGKNLMQQCIQFAIEFGYKKLYLESLPQFSQAIQMYEKHGFYKLDLPLGNSGHTSCNIWMLKELE